MAEAAPLPLMWAVAACRAFARHRVAAGPAWSVLCFTDACCLVPLRHIGPGSPRFTVAHNRAVLGVDGSWWSAPHRACPVMCLWADDGARFRFVRCLATQLLAGHGLAEGRCTELPRMGRGEPVDARYLFHHDTPCTLLRCVTLGDGPRALLRFAPLGREPRALWHERHVRQCAERHVRRMRAIVARHRACVRDEFAAARQAWRERVV